MTTRFIIQAGFLTFDQSHDFITDAEAYARYLEENAKTLMLNSTFDQVTSITSSNGTEWTPEDADDPDMITLDLKKSGISISYSAWDPEYVSITVDDHTRHVDSEETGRFNKFMRDMFAPIEGALLLVASPNDSPHSNVILTREYYWEMFKDQDGEEYSDEDVRKNFQGINMFVQRYNSLD